LKLAEKILLAFALLIFFVQLLPFFSGKVLLFLFSTFLLSASYLFASYWLFNSGNKQRIWIPLIAGMCFAVALVSIPFNVWVWQESVFDLLPLPNLLLCMLLGIFLFRNPMVWKQDMDMRRIFIRSLCIAVITAFFCLYTL